ncbi:hypothetical protein Q31b_48660 [Novipirellula aureliae]|uniref:Uncharacterized protein n=1 Tax=Novipirellula aureliae TaxID=2527966 RepID=A0A5C6DK14_9BACT|nr:hypothetical protein Q31b_48660 [Novipirellula aureliae]
MREEKKAQEGAAAEIGGLWGVVMASIDSWP